MTNLLVAPPPGAVPQSAEAFWPVLAPWLATCGITRVANITGLDNLGLPTCVAIRPGSRGLSVSQGKGFSVAQARVSAVMESIESWHAERIDKPLFHGSARRAREAGLRLVDVHALPHRPTRLPLEETPTQFVEMQALAGGGAAWVPFDCVSTDLCYDIDAPPVFLRSSNGLAAGQTHDQALLHALCELVERDAVQRWRHGPGYRQQAYRLQAGGSPLAPLLERCAAAGLTVLVWELGVHAALPCHAVMLLSSPEARAQRNVGAFAGFGCHPDPAASISAALCEAVQSRLTMISGARDDLFPEEFAHCRDDAFAAEMWQQHRAADILPLASVAAPTCATGTVVERVRQHYRQDVYWLDLGAAHAPFAVVRVLLPGLQLLGMDDAYYCQARGGQ